MESGSANIGGEAVNGAIEAPKLGMDTAVLCWKKIKDIENEIQNQ